MSCGRDWASWPRSTPVVSFPWNRSIRLNYHVNCFDILSFTIVAFGRSHLCEFGAASSVDELAAEVDGLRGIRLQLLFHSHFLSPDTCRKARRRQRKREREIRHHHPLRQYCLNNSTCLFASELNEKLEQTETNGETIERKRQREQWSIRSVSLWFCCSSEMSVINVCLSHSSCFCQTGRSTLLMSSRPFETRL